MDLSNLQTRLQTEFREMGEFSQTLGLAKLNGAICDAANKIWNKRPMPWMLSTFSLSTTDGSKGPYDPPSGFKGFPKEIRHNQIWWKDVETSYIIKDTDTQRWELYYDEITQKLYFRANPGTNTFSSVPYFPSFDTVLANLSTTITGFPEELFLVVKNFALTELLPKDATALIKFYGDKAEQELAEYYEAYDQVNRLPTQRAPMGMNGVRFDGIARTGSQMQRYLPHSAYGRR